MKSSEYRVNTFYIFHKIASERAVHIFADRGFTRGEEHLLVKKITRSSGNTSSVKRALKLGSEVKTHVFSKVKFCLKTDSRMT